MTLFKNKYRIEPARMDGYDYSSEGAYFITICTKERECFFGEIINEEMHLNDLGETANQYWVEIPKHFPTVELGEFMVMPNHIHGILILNKQTIRRDVACNVSGTNQATQKDVACNVSTSANHFSQISPKGGSIPTIIRSYKSAVTKHANSNNIPFGWQERFHDRIIRNKEEFERINNYIINNPANWETDKFYIGKS